jgi:hypothetical protein
MSNLGYFCSSIDANEQAMLNKFEINFLPLLDEQAIGALMIFLIDEALSPSQVFIEDNPCAGGGECWEAWDDLQVLSIQVKISLVTALSDYLLEVMDRR